MKFTRRSIVVFGSLLILLIFLVGFRLGRTIESADKNFVPPTKAPTPSQAVSPTNVPLELKTFTHPCGVSFSYPASMQESKQASKQTRLQDGTQSIEIECEKIASNSGNVVADVDTITPTPSGDALMMWQVRNTNTRQIVSFNVSENLVELVLKTLKLL
ncbi:MAG: hypothetical protein UZ22_OP11002000321 [Microgenomates bacterium OLB23]|nr:MAG: hypothetical protein UZ22_OP11002000321 [Microgenomates bacterium OLB23]